MDKYYNTPGLCALNFMCGLPGEPSAVQRAQLMGLCGNKAWSVIYANQGLVMSCAEPHLSRGLWAWLQTTIISCTLHASQFCYGGKKNTQNTTKTRQSKTKHHTNNYFE